jgi:hypothetical protein
MQERDKPTALVATWWPSGIVNSGHQSRHDNIDAIDPKRTRGSAIAEAAFGSKADMGGQSRRVRYPTSLKESRQSEQF